LDTEPTTQTATIDGIPAGGVVETTTPVVPTTEEWQSRIEGLQKDLDAQKREVDAQKSQVAGRARENARLRRQQENLDVLKQELKDYTADALLHAVEAIVGEEGQEVATPSRLEQLRAKIKSSSPKPEASTLSPEAKEAQQQIIEALEDAGYDSKNPPSIPDEIQDRISGAWTRGAYKRAVDLFIANLPKKTEGKVADNSEMETLRAKLAKLEAEAEERDRREKVAKGLRTDQSTSQGSHTPLYKRPIETLKKDELLAAKEDILANFENLEKGG